MTLVFKFLLIVFLLIIVFNLFKAMFTMLNPDPNKPPMSKFIGRRLLFSAALIILLVIALATGLIQPNARPY